MPVNFKPVVRYYSDSRLINEKFVHETENWTAHIESTPADGRFDEVDLTITFKLIDGKAQNCAVGLKFDFPDWSLSNYVCMPAAVYAGNKFESRPIPYPPLLTDPADWGVDKPTVITDIPRLNIGDGESRIQLMVRDLTTPAFGVFLANTKQGLWITTEQGTRLGDSGFDFEESDDRTHSTITLLAPGMREGVCYSIAQLQMPSTDKGACFDAGDEVTLRCKVYTFACADIPALFDRFIELRKDFNKHPQLKHELPFSAAWDLLEEKYNRDNWEEKHGFYCVGVGEGATNKWQLGWVGGGMATAPLLSDGSDLSKERALRNLGFIFTKTAAPSGFLYGIGDGENFFGDGFSVIHPHNMLLIRKDADMLYFALKQFILLDAMGRHDDISQDWLQTTRNLADAFVRLWERYGQFGQFIDIATGDILIGGSTSASTAPAGLALAAKYFDEPKYLDIAIKSAEQFYNQDTRAGITTGGPGEILQCADSESAFGLLESFVVLYEITQDRIWIERAEDMANQCASWCVSYDYKFPPESLFGRLDMRATGSVWANVQNKHSAPGICTLSGDSLLRLYRATGNTFYLDLLMDIAHGLTQYLSRPDRPVGNMPSGWMNERVNMSDWEKNIGGIFDGSCWPEVSLMLTYSEVPGIYIRRDTGQTWVFDNVEVRNVEKLGSGLKLTVHNPTNFDARVKLFAEVNAALSKPLSRYPLLHCSEVFVPAGGISDVHMA
ncbi:MAG: hypothetical protein ABFD64_01570 [Armatimonadota bacterium]